VAVPGYQVIRNAFKSDLSKVKTCRLDYLKIRSRLWSLGPTSGLLNKISA
jgi:hypothetical protein